MKKKIWTLLFFCSSSLFGWVPPVNVETSAIYLHTPSVVIDDNGNGLAIWIQDHQLNETLRFSVYDGLLDTWSPAQNLFVTPGIYTNLELAVDGLGNVAATWEEFIPPTTYQVLFSYYTAGSWSLPVVASLAAASRNPRVSLSSAGDGFIVWSNRLANTIEARSIALGGALGAISTISTTPGELRHPQIAMGAANDAIAAWQDFITGDLRSAENLAGVWQPDQIVTNTGLNNVPSVARSNTGYSLISWVEQNIGEVRGSSRPSAGAWTNPPTILSDAGFHYAPIIKISGANNGVVVWNDTDTGAIEGTDFTQGTGIWNFPPTVLSLFPTNQTPDLTLNGSGDGWAVWENVTNTSIEAISYTFGLGWGVGPTLLSAGGINYNPSVANNSTGNALAVWIDFDGTNYVVQATRDP